MKIAIVVQRYGLEINGGAELHARLLAERLTDRHDVTVLTSKSKNYLTWGNDYSKNEEVINKVKVLRYHSTLRNKKKFGHYCRKITKKQWHHKFFKFIKIYNFLVKKDFFQNSNADFNNLLKYQGPYTEKLINFIKDNKDNYSVFIFFTYLYYPTNMGLPLVANKSILIPTAHDEEPFYYKGYGNIFDKSKFIMYNCLSEKKLVEKTYPLSKKNKNDIAGVGFEPVSVSSAKIDEKYFVYIGRVDSSKNIEELITMFSKFNVEKKYKLYVIGKVFNSFDFNDTDIISLGFIPEEEKNAYLFSAKALIIPSLYESLSMVTLEAMLMGIPVIANAKCDVLHHHIIDSKAGFSYLDYKEFKESLVSIISQSSQDKDKMSENGKKYVMEYYSWPSIVNKFEKAFTFINSNNFQ